MEKKPLSSTETGRLIDGRQCAQTVIEQVREAVHQLAQPPGLAVVLVGEDPASQVYVRNKAARADYCGFLSQQYDLPGDISEAELLELIDRLNRDSRIHGILVQLPLPDHIDSQRIIMAIDPDKDVDGFHQYNVGRLGLGIAPPWVIPCTPQGVMTLLHDTLGADLSGLHAVVLGRSNIVGKPMAQLLLQQNCTVTLVHSRSRDIAALCAQADILVAAVGRAELVTADWVKPGAVVIDVGINRVTDADGKTRLVGDVDLASVRQKAAAITPVPGGVGPMTIAMLMRNTLLAAGGQL